VFRLRYHLTTVDGAYIIRNGSVVFLCVSQFFKLHADFDAPDDLHDDVSLLLFLFPIHHVVALAEEAEMRG
jgi:hypothetical protein